MSIAEMLNNDNYSEELRDAVRGIVLAKVTNITDPDKHNRVKCRVISNENDEDLEDTDWCPVMMPMTGASRGTFFMPGVDDIVLLAYLNADIHQPIVIGGLWTTESAAPYTVSEGNNFDFSIKTPNASELHFYDEADKQVITLTTPSGAKLEIDDANSAATFTDPDGSNSLKIDWNGGAVTLAAKTTLTLQAGATKIELKDSGEVTITSTQSISADSGEIKLQAKSKVSASGATGEVSATGSLDLKGTGGVNVTGATINLN